MRTQFGWHVIKVTDKKAAGTLPYDEVKAQLIAYLKTKKQEEAAQELLKSLRASAQDREHASSSARRLPLQASPAGD